MRTKQITAAAIVFAVAGAAFAQSGEYVDYDRNFVSEKSRAEVISELQQARAQGTLTHRPDTYPVPANQTRSQAWKDSSGGMNHSQSGKDTSSGVVRSMNQNHPNSNLYFGA